MARLTSHPDPREERRTTSHEEPCHHSPGRERRGLRPGHRKLPIKPAHRDARPARSPAATAYRAGVPDAVKDIAAINVHKADASRAYMRAHAHACRPVPGIHAIITGATIAACRRNRAAALARFQPVDGPGPDTPLERSCVGHEDSLRCAGVEQGDVARHYQETQRSDPEELTRDEAQRIWQERRDYFTTHPPHRARQSDCRPVSTRLASPAHAPNPQAPQKGSHRVKPAHIRTAVLPARTATCVYSPSARAGSVRASPLTSRSARTQSSRRPRGASCVTEVLDNMA